MVRKCTDDIPKMVIDQDSQTIADMRLEIPRGEAWLYAYAKKMVDSGKWDRVFKKVNGRYCLAFRPHKKG